jgi:hypothetical protein
MAAGAILTNRVSLRAADTNNSSEAAAPQPALGTDNRSNDQGLHYDLTDYYRSNELSLNLFGTATLGQYTIENWPGARVRNNAQFGAGAGLSYFLRAMSALGPRLILKIPLALSSSALRPI